MARLNDLAYSFEGSWWRGVAGIDPALVHAYVASVDGRPAGCLVVADNGDNADIELVAVVPEARGRGLSGKLLAHALADAAERGCATTSLVASELGYPVYERLGYRALGEYEMWERRSVI